MGRPRLKQLSPDGAGGGDHVEFDVTAGLWVPATPALQLVDHVSALADVTSLTLSGLASETDGAYLVTGRIGQNLNSLFELRPDGIAQTGIRSDWNQTADVTPAGSTTTSATGWIVAGGLSGDATTTAVTFFTAWIYPATNRHGSSTVRTGTRLFHMQGVIDGNVIGEHRTLAWGVWDDNGYPSFSSILVGGFGSTIERGSEVMLYKAKY